MTAISANLLSVNDLTKLPGLDTSELRDRLDVMILQEEKSYRCIDYIAKNKKNLRFAANAVDQNYRSTMCQWCYEVTEFCQVQREVVLHAFSYLDRYLCTKQGRSALVHREIYQIAVMTALYMAIKIHESQVIDIETLLEVSPGSYVPKDLERMECKMLSALEWKVNGPTEMTFIRYFLALMPEDIGSDLKNTIMNDAQHQVQLAVSKNNFIACRSSEIAFAAIMNATMMVDDEILSSQVKQDYVCSLEKFSRMAIDDNWHVQESLCLVLEEELLAVPPNDTHEERDIEAFGKMQPLEHLLTVTCV